MRPARTRPSRKPGRSGRRSASRLPRPKPTRKAGGKWARVGEPARQPHEYIRGGTAKLLTLFRPATGEVRAVGVEAAPNRVLHPWLQGELTQILAELPGPDVAGEWDEWWGYHLNRVLPP